MRKIVTRSLERKPEPLMLLPEHYLTGGWHIQP